MSDWDDEDEIESFMFDALALDDEEFAEFMEVTDDEDGTLDGAYREYFGR